MTNRDENAPISRQWIAIGVMAAYAIVAVVVRLIPFGVRPPNLAANGALGTFGGARTPVWIALPAQLLTLVVSDVILSETFNFKPFNIAAYIGFIGYLVLGRCMLRGNDSIGRIASVTFLGSLQFFLISNVGVWLEYGVIGNDQKFYDATLAGLLVCLAKGLPFFGFTLAGDLGFGAAMFGAEAWLYGVIHGEKPAEVPEEAAT